MAGVVALGVAPARPAEAAGFPFPFGEAREAAQMHWGYVPACTYFTNYDLPPGQAGTAEENGCHVWIDQGFIGPHWTDFCTVVVHEVGHLLGYTHDDGGVMTDGAGGPGVVPECWVKQQREDAAKARRASRHRRHRAKASRRHRHRHRHRSSRWHEQPRRSVRDPGRDVIAG